jgi:hypothetical protein
MNISDEEVLASKQEVIKAIDQPLTELFSSIPKDELDEMLDVLNKYGLL